MRGNGKIGASVMVAMASLMVGIGAVPVSARPATLPALFPAPASINLGTGHITLGTSVALVVAPGTDPETVALVRQILTSAGIETITTATRLSSKPDRPNIVLGTGDTAVVRDALARSNATLDAHAEGYTIASAAAGAGIVTLAGHDADGLFHAVQTFRQLAGRPDFPVLVIRDHPAMRIRGTIEGFYGAQIGRAHV